MKTALRWMRRIIGVMTIALLFSLLCGRFLPVSSTLMLARWVTGAPVERHWVPISAISPHLARAVIAAEDQRFCGHWGVDFIELQDVLANEDGPARGASTVSMQLAKNLWLWPGRSYIRKGLEIPLALMVDLAWGKTRVMEAYLNIAEWGDGVFGAEAAARMAFGKTARDLTPTEAARLVAALPNPLMREAGQPSATSRRIAARAAALGDLARCLRG